MTKFIQNMIKRLIAKWSLTGYNNVIVVLRCDSAGAGADSLLMSARSQQRITASHLRKPGKGADIEKKRYFTSCQQPSVSIRHRLFF